MKRKGQDLPQTEPEKVPPAQPKAECGAKPQLSVLTCFGDPETTEVFAGLIQHRLGVRYTVKITDEAHVGRAIRLLEQQRFDLVVAMVNNLFGFDKGADSRYYIVRGAELLAKVKTQYCMPVVALSGPPLEHWSAYDVAGKLKEAGITFMESPITPGEAKLFLDSVEICLKAGPAPKARPGQHRPNAGQDEQATETALGMPAQREASVVPPQSRGTRPPRIVVVDDESFCLKIFTLLIRDWLKDVTLLAFSKSGAAWRELSGADPDLLILDMHLRGVELLPLLAARKVKYPIVLTSGFYGEEEMRGHADPNLNVSCLSRPFDMETFRKVVGAALQSPAKKEL